MNKFSQSILERIKAEHRKPKARWIYLVYNISLWGFSLIAIFALGIFLAGLFLDISEAEWEIAGKYPGGLPSFLIQTFSWVWLAGIAAAVASAYVLMRKTKRGYRYGVLALAGVVFVASLTIGGALIFTPIPDAAQDLRWQRFHLPPPDELWQAPKAGLLLGEIIEAHEKLIIVNAIDQSRWEVDIAKAKIPPMLELKLGLRIRALGKDQGENQFLADFVLPADPRTMPKFMRKKILNKVERNFEGPAY